MPKILWGSWIMRSTLLRGRIKSNLSAAVSIIPSSKRRSQNHQYWQNSQQERRLISRLPLIIDFIIKYQQQLQNLQMLPNSLKQDLMEFGEYKEEQILKELLQLQVPPDQIEVFNEEMELTINCAFFDLIRSNSMHDILSLLNVLIISSSKNPAIKYGVILNLLENCFQCLCIQDLVTITNFLFDNIGNFDAFDTYQIYKLHRMLNLGLKRVPYSESPCRGQLYCMLSHILNLAHKSGLQMKEYQVKSIERCLTLQQHEMYFKDSDITYEFYQTYWKIQKHVTVLHKTEQNKLMEKILEMRSAGQPQNMNASLNNLINLIAYTSQLCKMIKDIINYFEECKPSNQFKEEEFRLEQFEIDLIPVPHFLIKYSKGKVFRLTFMFQILIYCMSFRAKINDHKIHNVQIDENIKNIENLARKYVSSLTNEDKESYFLKILQKYFVNEIKWVGIKNNPKKFKKKLVNTPKYRVIGVKQSVSTQDRSDTSQDFSIYDKELNGHNNIIKEQEEMYKRQMKNKLGIAVQNTIRYLKKLGDKKPKLSREATTPSFSCYFQNAKRCMQSFNHSLTTQQFFENWSGYHFFQWKALRCLYNQNSNYFAEKMAEISPFRNYLLLEFMIKKAGEFNCFPRKKLKPEEDTHLE